MTVNSPVTETFTFFLSVSLAHWVVMTAILRSRDSTLTIKSTEGQVELFALLLYCSLGDLTYLSQLNLT